MEQILRKLMALDKASARSIDENGFMHVQRCHITKAQVAPYYGKEIPGWQELKLEPNRVYYGWRSPEELEKSVKTWNGVPLQFEHHVDLADDPAKETRCGAMATDAVWNAPYIDCSLIVYDEQAKKAIESGSHRELSCAYRYQPDFTPGRAEDGTSYDFVMRDISANHVALVSEGRAGHDVVVADAKPEDIHEMDRMQAANGGIDKDALAQALQAALAALNGKVEQAPEAAPAPVAPAPVATDKEAPAEPPAQAPEAAPQEVPAAAPAPAEAPQPQEEPAEPIDLIKGIQAKLAPEEALKLGKAIQDLVHAASGQKAPEQAAPAQAPEAPAEQAEAPEAKAEAPEEQEPAEDQEEQPAEPAPTEESQEPPQMADPTQTEDPEADTEVTAEEPDKQEEPVADPQAAQEEPPVEEPEQEEVQEDEDLPDEEEEEADPVREYINRIKQDRNADNAAEGPAEEVSDDRNEDELIEEDEPEEESDEDESEESLPEYEHAEAMRQLGYDSDNQVCRDVFEAGRAYGEKSAKEAAGKKMQAALDQAMKAIHRNDKARYQAAKAVRHICGDVNPFAFDSAESIYGHALKTAGIEIAEYAPESYKGMVAMLANHGKAKSQAEMAADEKSVATATREFSYLDRIIIEE